MQGDPGVIELLNEVLTAELTAINQYFIHAKLCEDWGYRRLAEAVRHESIDEMKHAERVMDRILFLDGMPNMQRLFPVSVGETVEEQFRLDLALEHVAIERLNRGIAQCVTAGDHATRALLEAILVDEEEHTNWLETQLTTMEQIGEAHYLAQQLHS
ncbi:MAG: bacterioferritin [Ilumatobacteraceae bacterium]